MASVRVGRNVALEAPGRPGGAVALRRQAKKLAYRAGAMELFHRAVHGEFLTVVMLHRALPESERELRQADPLYTMSPGLLSEAVHFLDRYYTIVGAGDVVASLRRERPLPRRSMLITFDDGWHDNLEWALPALQGFPWALFVATDSICEPDCWWQEVLFWASRSGYGSFAELWKAGTSTDAEATDRNGDALDLLMRYGNLSPERRRNALAPYESALRRGGHRRDMLTRHEISSLRDNGVAIGSHGASHLPLTRVSDAEADLRRALEWLHPLPSPVMSFPHGRYNQAAISAARRLGYAAMFTSDAILNPCPGGWLQSDVIGRIPLAASHIARDDGTLAPELLAAELFVRNKGPVAKHLE